jgi:CRP/FNR family cyclic AMP-dependent transcriptional regulator
MTKDDQALARSALAELQLAADTNALRERMGAHPIKVDQFLFVVGRESQLGEKVPKRVPDLVLDDRQPFRMSRQHFMISRTSSWFVVRDLSSVLGTAVNGEPIGSHFRTDFAELKPGQNEIIAGGFGTSRSEPLFASFALAFCQ